MFHANLKREGGADFVRFRWELATRTLTPEVIDEGWFEIAADLGAHLRA